MEINDGFIRGDGIAGMIGEFQDRAVGMDQLRIVQNQMDVRADIAADGQCRGPAGDGNGLVICRSGQVSVQGDAGLFAGEVEIAARGSARDGDVQVRETADGSVIGRA